MTKQGGDADDIEKAVDRHLSTARAKILEAVQATLDDALSDPASPAAGDLAAWARAILSRRAARMRYFPPDLFDELGWEILLRLYLASPGGERLTGSDLTTQTGGSATSIARWLRYLESAGFVVRHPDLDDRRASLLELTDFGERIMSGYLTHIAAPPAPSS